MYPNVEIKLDCIRSNASVVKKICDKHNVDIIAVTKAISGNKEIAKAIVESGIKKIGDSRLPNIINMQEIEAEKWLIRMPMICEIKKVIKYVDVSLNSEWTTIVALNEAARNENKIHKIILMIDLGEIREGFVNINDAIEIANRIKTLSNIELIGIGSNMACLNYIRPTVSKMMELIKISKLIFKNRKCIISGGNSANFDMILKSQLPNEINNLRLGEAILIGKERSSYKYIPNTYKNTFILSAEIIEIKDKPSVPWGEREMNSYGEYSQEFKDNGVRKRAILAIGNQDCDYKTMYPIDRDIKIIGASSDHLIIDIMECERKYIVGDVVKFELGYFSIMRCFTSKFVKKIII